MEQEYEEYKLRGHTFRLMKYRTFKAACELEKMKLLGNPIGADDLIRANCKYEVLDRDNTGKVQGKKFIEIPDDIFEELSEEEGRFLLHETLSFMDLIKKKVKKKLKPEKKNGLLKKESEKKQD